MTSSTADPLQKIRKDWLKAAKQRQGPVCTFPLKGERYFPPHEIDMFGFGVSFCDVPPDYERKFYGL